MEKQDLMRIEKNNISIIKTVKKIINEQRHLDITADKLTIVQQ